MSYLPKYCFSVVLFSSFLFSPLIHAKSPPAKAKQCFSCHGVNGVSMNPEFPSLAGQSKNYLIKQLKAFKSGDRKNMVRKSVV